jgi:hypothetical protein
MIGLGYTSPWTNPWTAIIDRRDGCSTAVFLSDGGFRGSLSGMAASVGHVVVFVQENHTTDNYFRSMRAWGANVVDDWPIQPNPPLKDHAHTRAAYAKWLHAQQAGSPPPCTPSSTPSPCCPTTPIWPRRERAGFQNPAHALDQR